MTAGKRSGAKEEVRVRIAPSPTGFLHIGTARTALFNLLFAKKHGGTLILRIEDTDGERSKDNYEKDIMGMLHWLGILWDEGPSYGADEKKYIGDFGPYRQSERGAIYEKYIDQLLSESKAYYCFCTKEELEAVRGSMMSQGIAPKYSGKCRSLPRVTVEEKLSKNEHGVIRFKMPEGTITFNDLIRGKISFDGGLVGDIVIAKSKSEPFYNFAVVVDDHEMKISHVIRGEDHLGNTPKQIAIQEAFGFSRPEYAHLPLILNADRSKMSKRFLDVSVGEYRSAGYLPEALINFMALLGWHPSGERGGSEISEREIFSFDDLVAQFEIERVQKGGAVFNIEKLDWLNGQYLKQLSNEELLQRIEATSDIPKDFPKTKLLGIVQITRDRMKKIGDFKELADFFFQLADYSKEMLSWKETTEKITLENLAITREAIDAISAKDFKKEALMTHLTTLTDSKGRGEILWPLRVALSGREASPGPFEIMEILGKIETLKRIDIAAQKLTGGQQLAI